MPARARLTAGILLRSVDYGEADRIVTWLTDAFGRVSVMARGARKSTRRFVGALEPFAVIELEVALGRGELGRLASARLVRGYPRLLGRLDAMQSAGRALELVRAVAPERHADERLVPTVARWFELLDEGAPASARVAFELRFLAIAGWPPRLTSCGRCGRAAGEGRAALFDPGLGAIVCRACGGGPLLLGGALREKMERALGPRWDVETEWAPDEVVSAEAAIAAFVRRHLGDIRSDEGEGERR